MKACPLTAETIGDNSTMANCLGEGCGWWDDEDGCCAMVAIAKKRQTQVMTVDKIINGRYQG